MIINNQARNDVQVVGENTTKRAGISAAKLRKLEYMLTRGLYEDGITAVIAEWTNNGVDAVVAAKKNPVETPVLVKIEKNHLGQSTFSVEDFGIGLDEEQFVNVCMQYLESTKEEDEEALGAYGLGMKSFVSLKRPATFTCRKDGKERRFLVYEGSEFVEYNMLYEIDTDKPNGVKAEISITDYTERNDFITKAKQKLCYYDTAALLVDGQLINNEIKRNDLFQWSSLNRNNVMHFSLKDVYYEIDWRKLGISEIRVPVCIRFDLTEGIEPTPSREGILWNPNIVALFKKKIAEIADFFVLKYNENWKEYANIKDAWAELGNTVKNVNLDGTQFQINPLIEHSQHICNNIKIKGVEIRNPAWYKGNSYIFDKLFTAIGYSSGDRYATKERNYYSVTGYSKAAAVLVAEAPVGYGRDFLRDKHTYRWFYKANPEKRDLKWYKTWINLKEFKKDQWRGVIKEFELVAKQIEDYIFIKEFDYRDTKSFEDYCEERKEALKKTRSYQAKAGLNKQEGEITLSIPRDALVGNNIVFDKTTFDINKLYKQPKLFMYFFEEDKDKAARLYRLMKNTTVQICLIGTREVTRLPKFKTPKFIKFEKFMERDIKPFKRICSSILFREELTRYNNLIREGNEIINNCLRHYANHIEKLREYIKDIPSHSKDNDLVKEMLEVAYKYDLFDKQIWDSYVAVKEINSKFDFVGCLAKPGHWDQEAKKRYSKVISQMLLFRKKYYDDLEYAEIIFNKPQEKEDHEYDFWQPKINDDGYIDGIDTTRWIDENYVWKDKANLIAEYPGCTPIGYMKSDISDYSYQDYEEPELQQAV